MVSKKEISIWPLALLAALIPFVATHIAWWISIQNNYIPECIPYVDGCTSISRAARHGSANLIFKVMMIPGVFVQVFVWLALRKLFKKIDVNVGRSLTFIAIISGAFLMLYVVFLGTEGPIYQLLRRYGITVYFGATYLGQLIVHYRIDLLTKNYLTNYMSALTFALFPLGLIGLYYSVTTMDTALNDNIENVIEWNMSLLMMIWFVILAFVLKKERFKVKF